MLYKNLKSAAGMTLFPKQAYQDSSFPGIANPLAGTDIYKSNFFPETIRNQLLQLCTARTAWCNSVIRSETSFITESDRRGPIR